VSVRDVMRGAVGAVEKRLATLYQVAKFYLLWLPAVLNFKRQERLAFEEISPRLWLSSAEIIERDLALYDEIDGFKLDKPFLDDLVKTRTDLQDRIGKRVILSIGIFIFLFANFLSVKVNFKVGGFDFSYGPGIPEGLLLISNLIAVHTLMMQNTLHIMDSTIRFIVGKIIPPELHQIYLAKIFTREHYPSYSAYNLPHITFNNINSFINKYTAIGFVILIFGSLILFMYCNLWMISDLILNPKMGWISVSIGIYILIMGIFSLFYVIITRMKLPYTDYTVNNELELLAQIDPAKRDARLAEIYGKVASLRRDMEKRGYLKER
jgi:hypothetical protein